MNKRVIGTTVLCLVAAAAPLRAELRHVEIRTLGMD
jgi:hypothetical protein